MSVTQSVMRSTTPRAAVVGICDAWKTAPDLHSLESVEIDTNPRCVILPCAVGSHHGGRLSRKYTRHGLLSELSVVVDSTRPLLDT